jgi:hypothetical protein
MNWPIERFDFPQIFAKIESPQRKQSSFIQPLLALRAPIRGHFFQRGALCSSASARICWQSHDSPVGIGILLGGKLAIAEDHSADERPY